jgi:hypothetical protein
LAGSINTDAGRAGVRPTQDADKMLDIERYPNEPLELVDINVGVQSVKHKLKIKSRNPVNKWGRDTVKFREKNGWFKHVKIRLRNISGRTIYGFAAAFHFEVPQQRVLFRMLLTRTRNLEREPLQAGEEIELEVSDQSLNRTKARMGRLGVDIDLSSASFSVDSALFSDNLMWYRGVLLRRDPGDANKWSADDKPAASGANHIKQASLFKRASFSPPATRPQTDCQQAVGGFLAFQCPDDFVNCNRIHEVGNGNPGQLSLLSMVGDCERTGVACQMQALHDRFVQDPNCGPCTDNDQDGFTNCQGDCNDTDPSLTPQDWDGDGYSTCGGDCDDTDNTLYPDHGCVDPNCISTGWEGYDNGNYGCASCYDGLDNDCNGYTDLNDYACIVCLSSPLVIDVLGDGFRLTNAANGVAFDLNSDGTPERLAWTAPQADDAWLSLDRNGNGTIDNGSELFGNFTPQPDPPVGVARNGFNALAVYDRAEQGGNGDGLINKQDAIFASLRLWQDANHNGFSETNELRSLRQLGLKSIDLDYKESRRKDQHGNWFRYRAKVWDTQDAQLGRWAWDVFLVSEASRIAKSTARPQSLFQRWVRSLMTRTGYSFEGRR